MQGLAIFSIVAMLRNVLSWTERSIEPAQTCCVVLGARMSFQLRSASGSDGVDIEGPWKHIGQADSYSISGMAYMSGTQTLCISVRSIRSNMRLRFKDAMMAGLRLHVIHDWSVPERTLEK